MERLDIATVRLKQDISHLAIRVHRAKFRSGGTRRSPGAVIPEVVNAAVRSVCATKREGKWLSWREPPDAARPGGGGEHGRIWDYAARRGARSRRGRMPPSCAALGRRSVVLVGMMGAGKSSVGRRLALRLGIPFVDADTEIEKAAGMTIPDIFATHGEPYFRAGEARVIARLLEGGPQVLATGGGAFMNADTRAAIGAKGISVWLKADVRRADEARSSAAATGRCSRPPIRRETLRQADGRALSGLCRGRSHGPVARRAARHDRRRDRRARSPAGCGRAGAPPTARCREGDRAP